MSLSSIHGFQKLGFFNQKNTNSNFCIPSILAASLPSSQLLFHLFELLHLCISSISSKPRSSASLFHLFEEVLAASGTVARFSSILALPATSQQPPHRLTTVVDSTGGAISWQYKLQKCMASSNTEAEYIAVVEASKETLWSKWFLQELDLNQDLKLKLKKVHTNKNGANMLKKMIPKNKFDVFGKLVGIIFK